MSSPDPHDSQTNQTSVDHTPEEVAKLLAFQVEKWYTGGMEKRDKIVAKLRSVGHDDLADEIERWYENGSKRFTPLLERLNEFRIR